MKLLWQGKGGWTDILADIEKYVKEARGKIGTIYDYPQLPNSMG